MDYSIPRLVTAGKTGTSSDQLSAQFVGFVPGMVTAVSMYQSDDAGNSVPLDDVGGLGQFHGGDWPVDVWIDYMKPATANLPGDDFPWKVESNRKVHNNAPTPAPSATTEAPQSAAEPTETPTPTETPPPSPPRILRTVATVPTTGTTAMAMEATAPTMAMGTVATVPTMAMAGTITAATTTAATTMVAEETSRAS